MVVVKGKEYAHLVGTRAQVGHGTAYKTSYGAVKPRGDALTACIANSVIFIFTPV